jgi:hypothetical protein
MADHDILEIARKIRYDLTAAQAKLSELMRLAALLEVPDEDAGRCPECGMGAGSLPQGVTLADHRFRAHDVEAIDGRAA